MYKNSNLTRRPVREPGWEGNLLILLRLISSISSDGITVNYACANEPRRQYEKKMARTTSGKIEKLLFFKLRYLRRDKSANAMGRIASLLYPRAILGCQKRCQNKCKESSAGISYLRTELSSSMISSRPIVASSSAPDSPTSVKFLCVKSKVAPLSGDCLRASAMCIWLSEVDGSGGDTVPFLVGYGEVRPAARSASDEDIHRGRALKMTGTGRAASRSYSQSWPRDHGQGHAAYDQRKAVTVRNGPRAISLHFT
jgi:hypothetical protein